MELKKAKDIEKLGKIDILVYGGSGTGKTHFAGTFNKAGEVFFFDFDGGMRTLRGWDNISFITITETLPRPTGWSEFSRLLPQVEKDVIEGKYNTVVIDSLTTLGDAALNSVMHQNNKVGQQPTFPEWGEQMRRIKMTVDRVLTWRCNVILTAHEEFNKDEVTGKVWCLPMVTGKLSNRIGINFDEVYHLSVEGTKDKTEYSMLTRADRYYTAKSRLGYDKAYVESGYETVKKAMER